MRGEAIKLASRGFRVFAVRAGQKRPVNEGWQREATSDAFSLLETFPEAANIGIATGEDFTVIDADAKSGGLEGVETLGLPPTLTVRTAGGGLHFYFKTPAGHPVGNSVGKIAQGVDVRGVGGLVVGPGSVVDGRPYTIERDLPVAELPAALLARCHAARERHEGAGKLAAGVQGESAAGAARARQYVTGAAPEATQGNRDDTAAKVAARIYDFTPSRDTCLELLELWNETKCSPPLDDEDLERIAWSMRRSKGSSLGRDDPLRYFDEIEDPPPDPSGLNAFTKRVRDYTGTEELERAVTPRAWLLKGKLIREAVTLLGAPGSAGKSLWSLQVAVALAIGSQTLGDTTIAEALLGTPVLEETSVLVVNNEDPNDELDRRLAAVMTHWGIPRENAHGRIKLFSGAQQKFRLVKRSPKGGYERSDEAQMLVDYVRKQGIGCIVFDPFVSLHGSNENDNTEMQAVMDVLTAMAAELRVSILLVHHTAKPQMASADGYAGNVNSIRGASAIKDAARAALTMFVCSKKDGEEYGIPSTIRHRHVRLDGAKPNYHLDDGGPEWFRKESVKIANGEWLGVLVPVKLERKKAEVREAVADATKNAADVLAKVIGNGMTLNEASGTLKMSPLFKTYSSDRITALIMTIFDGGAAELDGRKFIVENENIRPE